MKKITTTLIALITLLLLACETNNIQKIDTALKINGNPVKKYIIDSCEYIGSMGFGQTDYLTHKGNCKFCEKRRKTTN